MKHFNARLTIGLVIVEAIFVSASTGQARAQATGNWYYCDPAQAYYPYVRTCPVPWREVAPNGTPPNQFGSPPARTDEPKLVCEVGGQFVTLTPTECEAENARLRAQSEAQQEEAKREAAEQQAAAQRKYQDDLAARVQSEKDRGYEPTEFSDFQLDGKDLATRGAKVAIQGVYIKIGNVEYLMPSTLAIAVFRETGRTDQGIGLLTDDSPRNVRKFFLACRDNIGSSQIGCQVTILGRVTACEMTTLVAKIEEACVVVDDSWTGAPPL